MAIMQIPASYSFTLSNDSKRTNFKAEKLLVGNRYKCIYCSYLYFDLSAVSNWTLLKSATLLLFKVSDFFDCPLVKFSVYPSQKQLSSFSGFEADWLAELDPRLKSDFFPFTREAAIEVDITVIVNKWLNNELANRGLIIKSNNNPYFPCVAAFASTCSKANDLTPFIKLELKQGPYICLLPNSDISYTASVFPNRTQQGVMATDRANKANK